MIMKLRFADIPTQADFAASCLVINTHFKIEIRQSFDEKNCKMR